MRQGKLSLSQQVAISVAFLILVVAVGGLIVHVFTYNAAWLVGVFGSLVGWFIFCQLVAFFADLSAARQVKRRQAVNRGTSNTYEPGILKRNESGNIIRVMK